MSRHGAVMAATLGAAALAQPASEAPRGRIGQEVRVEYRFPLDGAAEGAGAGPRLKESPLERGAPLVLRIAGVQRRDGDEVYDVRVIPEIGGEFDVSAFLERTDGGSMRRAPTGWFVVDEHLAADHALELSDDRGLGPRSVDVGGYRSALLGAGAAWAAIPCVALAVRLSRRREPGVPIEPAPAPTVVEQLRPLIDGAVSGVLSVDERARLEMLLIAAYRGRLALDGLSAGAALARLRSDPDAGAVITAVERWLHAPIESAERAAESADSRRASAARLLARFNAQPEVSLTGSGAAAKPGEEEGGR